MPAGRGRPGARAGRGHRGGGPPGAGGAGGAGGDGTPGAAGEPGGDEEQASWRRDLQRLSEAIAGAEQEGGYPAARRVFDARKDGLPPGLLWRTHLELAEYAKRGAAVFHVSYHLSEALQAQPKTVQVWLESSRTLDELGELEECRALLERGLECCAPNDQLCLKLVRVLERLGDHAALRALLATMRREPVERTCKVLLDAAHFEVRAGNGEAVRALLNCMMHRIPHQGPVYCEACRIEGILGNWQRALKIAELGVQKCLKYGPLWFVLLRLAEKSHGARAVKEYAAYALRNISPELYWKVHFEVAAAYGREGSLRESRQSIGRAALSCPSHLRWKVWLLAARSELWDGSTDAARRLLAQARADAPARVQVAVCIERARTEEFLGCFQEAREALAEAHACEGHDWKAFLEHIFMEARHGCLPEARKVALNALELHPATGRLWSAFIALEHSGEGSAAAMVTFRRAARDVPKSGEIWCEGARVFMNPLGAHFHLARARKCLEFAVHLTPQYGDSFLELLRLRFLLELCARMRADPLAVGLLGPCATAAPEAARAVASDPPDQGQRLAVAALTAQRVCIAAVGELRAGRFSFTDAGDAVGADSACGGGTSPCEGGGGLANLQPSRLEVFCAYAEPNYGFLWFWCRDNFLSTPDDVLLRMREEVFEDLVGGGSLWAYAWAIACGVFGLRLDDRAAQGACPPPAPPMGGLAEAGITSCAGSEVTMRSDEPPQPPPPLGAKKQEGAKTRQPFKASSANAGSAGAAPSSALAARDFAVGSLRLSRCFACSGASLDQAERRRLIFGSDILCV